ncbi:MAG: glycosyltransferase family 2 protein [Nodosilinea sp.]
MNPKVSVIIPAYNAELYVAKSIKSVLHQTYNNLEIIVVDDASSDGTLRVIKSISDSRICCLSNEKNLGAGLARNNAISQASGEWIALLDSDDWFAPNRIECLLELASRENADMVSDNLSFVRDESTPPYATLLELSSEKIVAITAVSLPLFLEADTCGKFPLFSYTKPLIKKSFLKKYCIKYDTEAARVGEDFRFYLRCLVHGAHFLYTPNSYYFQRMYDGSLTTQSKIKIFDDFYTGNKNLLKEPLFQQNAVLVDFLVKDSKHLKNNIAYYSVIEPLKQKKFFEAASALIQNPFFIIRFLGNVPQILSRRLNSLLSKTNNNY